MTEEEPLVVISLKCRGEAVVKSYWGVLDSWDLEGASSLLPHFLVASSALQDLIGAYLVLTVFE